MADNESTTKIKVDLSELKSEFQTASRLIRVANSEFKAAASGMENWGTSADGVSAKIKQLTDVVSAQKTQLSSLEAQYKLVVEAEGETSKGAQELEIKINNQKAAINKTNAELTNYKTRLSDIETAASQAATAQKDIESASDKVKKAITDQKNQLEFLKQQYQDTVLVQGQYSTDAQALKSKINSLSGEIEDNEKKLSEAAYAADDLAEAVEDAGKAAENSSGGFSVLKGALASLLADGIKGVAGALADLATDSKTAMNSFSAQTGKGAKETELFSQKVENLYKQNFGESMNDVAEAMANVAQQTDEIDPSKIEAMTKSSLILRDTFGYEVSETMRTVNQLMNQFGISSEEAFNMVAQGAQNGLDKNGNLLDTLNEYSPKYAQMGLSAEEMFNSLQNGADAGAFDIDKLGDAMNEFSIRVKDGTADDAFKAMGADVGKLKTAFGNGGESAKTAMGQVFDALNRIKDPLKRNELGVQLFGSMWEDMGGDAILAMGKLEGSIDGTSDTMEKINAVKYDDIGSALAGIGRTLKVELLQPLVDLILPHLETFVAYLQTNLPLVKQWFKDALSTLQEWLPVIIGVGTAIATYFVATKIIGFINAIKDGTLALKLMAAGQTVLNTVMSMNPIGLVVAAIAGLVAAFIYLWNNCEGFRQFWIDLWENIKIAASAVGEWLANFFTVTLPGWFNSFIEMAGGFLSSIGSFFAQLGSTIWEWLKVAAGYIWDWVTDTVSAGIEVGSKFLSSVVSFFTELPGKIWEWLKNAWSKVTTWAGNMVDKAKETGSKFLSKIVEFFKQLPGKIWDFYMGVITKTTTWALNMVKKAKEAGTDFLEKVISFFAQLPGKVWAKLVDVITKVKVWITNLGTKAAEAGKKFLDKVIEKVKSLPGKMKDWLDSAIDNVVSWASSLAEKGKDAATSLFDSVVDNLADLPGSLLDIGSDLVEGLWNGISDMGSWIGEKIKGFGEGVLGSLKSFFGIKSPSRVMRDEVGNMLVEGLAVGLDENVRTAVKSMQNLTKQLMPEAEKATSLFDDIGFSDNKISVARSSVSGMRQRGNFTSGNTSNSNSFTFNQYNNSPKALSRLEIYRQTRNQLNFAKGV